MHHTRVSAAAPAPSFCDGDADPARPALDAPRAAEPIRSLAAHSHPDRDRNSESVFRTACSSGMVAYRE
jgi:hypothetical protein